MWPFFDVCVSEFVADIVFDYRQKVTRSFEYLQGDYYIAPVFMVHFAGEWVFSFTFLFWLYFIYWCILSDTHYLCLALAFQDKVGKVIQPILDFMPQETKIWGRTCFLIRVCFLHAVVHIVKNYIAHLLNAKVPLILGVYIFSSSSVSSPLIRQFKSW